MSISQFLAGATGRVRSWRRVEYGLAIVGYQVLSSDVRRIRREKIARSAQSSRSPVSRQPSLAGAGSKLPRQFGRSAPTKSSMSAVGRSLPSKIWQRDCVIRSLTKWPRRSAAHFAITRNNKRRCRTLRNRPHFGTFPPPWTYLSKRLSAWVNECGVW